MLPDDKSQQRVQKLFSELEQITHQPLATDDESGTEKEEVVGEVKVESSAERDHAEVEEQTRQTRAAQTTFFNRLMENPIIAKELKGRMRGRQGFLIIGVYLLLIGFFIFLIYFLLTLDSSISNSDPSFLQTMGKVIFSTVVLLELLMLGFIGPALTSGAISSERERKTIDLLKTSLLSARSIVFGKLGSATAFLLLLIFTAIPLQSLAFFLGGVGMAEIVVSTLMLVVTAIFFCALGMFFSSFAQRTLIATVYSYATILVSFIFFVLLLFSISIFDSYSYSNPSSTLFENITTIAVWFLFSTNSLFAAVMSEVILVEDQSLFLTNSGFFGNTSLTLPSPWIIYFAFYIVLTVVLISLSIYFVNRPDR
jgi:ABC-type transport system involved in multi-copper enzyme maturation permease subunit